MPDASTMSNQIGYVSGINLTSARHQFNQREASIMISRGFFLGKKTVRHQSQLQKEKRAAKMFV